MYPQHVDERWGHLYEGSEGFIEVVRQTLTFFSTWKLFAFEGIRGQYIDLIADVLTLYVLIELSRSLVEYFTSHRLRLTFIADAAIVFVIREVLIALFQHELKPEMLYALSLFLFVLGALRIGSVIVYQREKRMSLDASPQ